MTHDANDSGALDAVWASPRNVLSPTQKTAIMEELMNRIEQEKTNVNRVTAIAGFILILFTARILFDAVTKPGVFDIGREWATIALLILPWIALFAVRWRMTSGSAANGDSGETISDMLNGALRDNAAARWRIRFLGLALTMGAAFTGVALFQLIETGKMTERNAYQGALLFGGVLAAVGVYMVVHYMRVLRPEARRLKQLLAESDD